MSFFLSPICNMRLVVGVVFGCFFLFRVSAQEGSVLRDSLLRQLNQAASLLESGDFAKGSEIAWQCIQSAEKAGIPGIKGRAYHFLAGSAFFLQDLKQAQAYAHASLAACKQEGDVKGMGNAFNLFTTIFLGNNQLDSAYLYGWEMLRSYRQTGDSAGVALAYTKLGHVFNLRQAYTQATPYYLRSYEISAADTLSDAFMTANLSLASNYIYLKKTDAALRHARKSYEIAQKRHSYYEQGTSLQYLSGIYEMKGDLGKALAYERMYTQVRDSVLQADRIRQVKELEVKYESAEKEAAIRLLEKDRARQRAVLWAALATAALLLMAAITIYRSYRQRTSDNEKLSTANALLEAEKIIARQKLEAEQRELERMGEMDAFKSRFFVNISHEFRTPLTVILGLANRWAGRSATWAEAEVRQSMQLIRRNGENLLHLINEILDLAKLESQNLTLNYVQGDILARLRYTAESVHSLADAAEVSLRMECPVQNILMDYDAERLQQVVYNLLSNAIKFTPSGGQVTMRVETTRQASGETLHIAVADTGAGIPASELPFLFNRFFQAGNQSQARAGGAGIGLSLTRELVRAMGGDIQVQSREQQGSVFTVTLPISRQAPPEPAIHTLSDGAPPPVAETLPEAGLLPTDDLRPQLLLVEDNPDVMEYLRTCLQTHFRLDFAADGRAGIDKALDTIPDLILSDVMMPYKDGLELCDILKNDERSSHIPIVLLTAKADVESRVAGLRRGADAYLAKPFHEEELLLTLNNLLELRNKWQVYFGKTAGAALSAPEALLPPPDLEPEITFLEKINRHLEAHLDESGFDGAALAKAMLMSEVQLYRKIKALTGKSTAIYLRSLRLQKSLALLRNNALNISEVAYAIGFEDPNYFSRTFTLEFGMSPSEMRRKIF